MFDSETLCRVLFDDIGLPAEADFAVAYSGGCDSLVLLHALSEARRGSDFNFSLTALHFDHGLNPQSARWARQCAALCEQWNIPFISERQALVKRPGESLEAQARERRYRWFERVVEPGGILLTAHHADDQAETVLLNLLRGGGLASLAGIAPLRPLSAAKSTRVARPLLAYSREALSEYARRHRLSWIEDPSNQSPEFDRNFLRQSVMPLLEQRWPAAASLGKSAKNCRQAVEFLDQVIQPVLQRCQVAEKRGVFCLAPPLNVGALKPLGRFQTRYLLRHWLHRHGRRSPSTGQLATLFEQLFEAESESAGLRWDAAELRYFNGHLYLIARLEDAPAGETLDWDWDWDLDLPQALNLNKNSLRVEVIRSGGDSDGDGHTLDPQRLRGKSIQLIWRKGGERMTLPGRQHSSELKKLFQQKAIPPWERHALPLLMADGEVAWAHGVGAGAAYCCEGNEAGVTLRFVAGSA